MLKRILLLTIGVSAGLCVQAQQSPLKTIKDNPATVVKS